MWEKRSELWDMKLWLLHHDNALAYNALRIWEFLTNNDIAVLEQPPYLLDLALRDFFYLLRSNESLKEFVSKTLQL